VSLTSGSWALSSPATETLWEVICCPEDGRLTFEGWVAVVKVNPRHSPNTNGFNNHYVVQCSNPFLERSAAEPLIVTRPSCCQLFGLLKEYPRLSVTLKSATVSHPTTLSCPVVSLANTTKRTQRLQKSSFRMLRVN
jgi:hypothetical protein